MLTRASRGFGDDGGHARGASFRDHNAIGARCIGGAQDCAEVVRILHAIEDYDQRVLSALGGDYIFKIVILLRRSDGDHALVRIVAGHLVEFVAEHEAHGNSLPPAFIDDMLQAKVMAFLGDSNPGEGAATSLQRLGNGIDPIDVIHVLVV